MAIEFISQALKQNLPTGPKFVLVALANRANHDGMCWPSHKDISQQTGISVRSIINHIKALCELGFLQVSTRRRDDGYKTSNGYKLTISSATISGENNSREKTARSQVQPLQDNITTIVVIEPSLETSVISPEKAKQIWNQEMKGILSEVRNLTTPRQQKLKSALIEIGGEVGWRDYLARIRGSPFLTGDNDRGWKADFDFVLQPKQINKILEGSYQNGKSKPTVTERLDSSVDRILAEYGVGGTAENPADFNFNAPMLRHPEQLRTNTGANGQPHALDDRRPSELHGRADSGGILEMET